MRNLIRAALITAWTALAGVGLASPALAHVRVSAINATQGGYGVLTFRAPTESDTASTTELRVTLPHYTPICRVATPPKPGRTATLTKENLPLPQTDSNGTARTQYVSQDDWKADNPQAAIPPHQFDMFNISVGQLPKAATLALPTEQFYSDGHTVNWNEDAVAGQSVPKHPTPVLTLASGTSDTDSVTTAAPPNSAPAWSATLALVVAIVALLIALADLALLRRRS